MKEDRSIRLLGFKRFSWTAVVRLVSTPIVYKTPDDPFVKFRIALVLDRRTNDLRVLEGGDSIFNPFGEWAWKTRTNPCDERIGTDWTIRRFPLEDSHTNNHKTPLTDRETQMIDNRWPSWQGLKEWGIERARRHALLNSTKMWCHFEIPPDPPKGMYDKVPQDPHPKCRECGRCCMLFVDQGDEGAMPSGIMSRQEWFEQFHTGRHSYGVKPLFDAHLIHEPGNENAIAAVRSRGLNPDSCPYLGSKGCVIPWEKRPWRCKRYRCPEWRNGWI